MKGFVVTILGLNKDRSVLFLILSWDLRLALQETRTRTAIILSDSESVNSTVQKVNKLQRRSVSDKTQKLQIFKWWKWKKIRRESIGHKKQAKVIRVSSILSNLVLQQNPDLNWRTEHLLILKNIVFSFAIYGLNSEWKSDKWSVRS